MINWTLVAIVGASLLAGLGIYGCMRRFARERLRERRLRRLGRLELDVALYALSRAYQHDCNNLVMVLNFEMDKLRRLGADHPQIAASAAIVEGFAQELRSIASRLHQGSNPATSTGRRTELLRELAEAGDLLSGDSRMRLTVAPARDLRRTPWITGDPDRVALLVKYLIMLLSGAGGTDEPARVSITASDESPDARAPDGVCRLAISAMPVISGEAPDVERLRDVVRYLVHELQGGVEFRSEPCPSVAIELPVNWQ